MAPFAIGLPGPTTLALLCAIGLIVYAGWRIQTEEPTLAFLDRSLEASMPVRWIAWTVWTLLVLASFLAAPPQPDDLGPWLTDVMTGRWDDEEPWVVAVFQLMGVWPFVMAGLLASDLRSRPLPAWPFVLGSMFLGAFVLLPWFGLRPEVREAGTGRLARITGHRAWGAFFAAVAAGWIAWAMLRGDWMAWEAARRGNGFLWVMSLDFGALWTASLLAAWQDARQRGGPWQLAVIPLVGAALWLAVRPARAPSAPHG